MKWRTRALTRTQKKMAQEPHVSGTTTLETLNLSHRPKKKKKKKSDRILQNVHLFWLFHDASPPCRLQRQEQGIKVE
jgi:hypothetical protein